VKRAESIESLLKRTRDELKNIAQAYRACADSPDTLVDVPDSLKIDIHDFLAHNRAILDYLAQEIANLCSPRPERPYFPIASREKTVSEFQDDLNRWFPGLHITAPELFDYLIDIQHFRDSPWLLELKEIVNFNKHNDLSSQRRGEFVSLIVHFRGVVLRVGELGLKSITIEPGAVLQLRATNGEVRAIRGPQVIDINTTHLADADPGIMIERIRWIDFKMDPSEHSAVGLLRIINLNVQRVCDKVTHLVAK
jgi:hypothetical protein